MPIPYKLLPTYSDLFLNYISDFEKLRKYFEYDFHSYEEIFKCIDLKKETYQTGRTFFRNDLCEILNEQNSNFNSGESAFENIKLLSSHDTFTVVTGQQLGILTGPYYTILKALNTIQLSEKLNDKFPEFKFIPVFWLEGDDHDFSEINNLNIISKENEIRNIKYFENGIEQEKYLKPTGDIKIDNFIDTFISELEDSLNKTDFTESVFNEIKKAYKEGIDLKTAFARYMNSLIINKGLVFIDPTDARIKKFLKPVFEKELTTFPLSCETVINTSVDLEEKYSAQVKAKAINLFYIHEGNRYLLEPRENEIFALKNSRQKFTKDELFEILESNPERFSWNVVTRPICQDYLLPTVAYVGGPSEIAYFAQFRNVYKFFDITMPVIFPRTSVTILENRIKSFLEKNELEFEELFDLKEVGKKLLKNGSDADLEEIFSNMKEELTAIFYSNEKILNKIDVNQTNSFGKRNQQFLDSLAVAKDKYQSIQLKQNEVVSNQLKRVLTNVFPEETLQERVLNIIYFINKYDISLIDKMINEVKIDEFSHQILFADSYSAVKE